MLPLNIYIFMASTVFPSELSDARISWIQNCILTVVVDDFFDGGGSREELKNLTELFEKWDAHREVGFFSEHVRVLFFAVYNTSNKIGTMAAKIQNRRVIGHIAQLWLDYLRVNMTIADWTARSYVPTMEEYMPVGETSYALGPILLTPMYLVGPELSEDMIRCPEYKELFRHTSICGRLLNDLQTYKKESIQGNVNSVLLHALHYGGSTSQTSIEAAVRDIRKAIVVSRRELLRLVLRDGTAVPRQCREIFWNMCKVSHLFYLHGDGFCALQELAAAANAVIHEPLKVTIPSLDQSLDLP
ncbi:unnamed protein product [Urochloa humidicola]